jgi:hypothetical protein
METTVKRTCTALTKRGQPCQATAVERGLCAAHAGLVDMKAIGSKGGKQSVRSRLGIDDAVATDELRRKARRRLEEMLDSPDEGKRLRAATALFSYSAQKAQADEKDYRCTCQAKPGEYCPALEPHGYRSVRKLVSASGRCGWRGCTRPKPYR